MAPIPFCWMTDGRSGSLGTPLSADREGRQNRVDMDLVLGTTLAISTCSKEGRFNIRYFLKKKEGRFISSFGDKQWMWPQDPFKVHDRLYIPLVVIESTPEMEGPFKFKITGHKIAMIRNYHCEDPHGWSVEYLDWSAAIPSECCRIGRDLRRLRQGGLFLSVLCSFRKGSGGPGKHPGPYSDGSAPRSGGGHGVLCKG